MKKGLYMRKWQRYINHKITQIFTEYNNRDEELRIEIDV